MFLEIFKILTTVSAFKPVRKMATKLHCNLADQTIVPLNRREDPKRGDIWRQWSLKEIAEDLYEMPERNKARLTKEESDLIDLFKRYEENAGKKRLEEIQLPTFILEGMIEILYLHGTRDASMKAFMYFPPEKRREETNLVRYGYKRRFN